MRTKASVSTMNEIKLAYVSITYKEPIVYFVYAKDVELGFPEMRELISSAEALSGHKPYFTFSDVRANLSITKEGKRVVEDLATCPFSEALLYSSKIMRTN
jgi:hypothetical protein